MTWLQTHTGEAFDLLNPTPESFAHFLCLGSGAG